VGSFAIHKLHEFVKTRLPLKTINTATEKSGHLNHMCGADYVKTTQKLPPAVSSLLNMGQRGCSLDGDADRLIYFYKDALNQVHILDGDKIAALVAEFIVDLVDKAGLSDLIKVGIVQTAYANGNSTYYLSQVSNQFPPCPETD
jgi:phosphoacetylglucosamine mutase